MSEGPEAYRVAVAYDDGGPATVFEHLWTPYRMAYIRGEGKPTGDARLPVLRDPDDERRGRADRRPGDDGVRRPQPVPVQRRPPDGGPVPARARLHRPHRRRGRRARRVHPDGDAGRPLGQRRARVQHRHEPGLGRRRRHRRPPAPARRAALGRRHQLHAGHRADPGAAAGARARPAALLAGAWAGTPPYRSREA